MPELASEQIEVVRRLYDAMAARDLDAILAIVDPDVVVHQAEELPWGGTFHGHAGLGEFMLKLIGTIESRVTTRAMFAAGDKVIQVGTTAGTVLATGRSFSLDEVHVLTLVAGRVVRFEPHIDTPAMLAALGKG